jgi:ribosomal-protein-alanine N-acetyltransferase
MNSQTTAIRLIEVGDAEQIAAHFARDVDDFARWEPAQSREYYTTAGPESRIGRALDGYGKGDRWPGVILADNAVIGQVTISNVIRGPFQKGSLGYWVAVPFQGQGHATRAVRLAMEVATGELGLHRIEATTQMANLASHEVLRRNDFITFGIAHSHIFINGAWRDGVFWERSLHDRPL